MIHPQHWPEDLDYSGKRVVVIGSGATAVTLVPAMTDKAAHVTMLQRSPTYMVSLPSEDKLANWGRRNLPTHLAYDMTRLRKILFQQFFFRLARSRPAKTRERLLALIREQLGPDYDMETHFTPPYNPWEQRLCLVPDNDMFIAIREGKASVVTDHDRDASPRRGSSSNPAKSWRPTSSSPRRASICGCSAAPRSPSTAPRSIPARATPTRARCSPMCRTWRFVFGYTNASWTLRADLICEYTMPADQVSRRRTTSTSATPRDGGAAGRSAAVRGLLVRLLPACRAHACRSRPSKAPWKQNQSYMHDIFDLRFGPLEDGVLEFKKTRACCDGARARNPHARVNWPDAGVLFASALHAL